MVERLSASGVADGLFAINLLNLRVGVCVRVRVESINSNSM